MKSKPAQYDDPNSWRSIWRDVTLTENKRCFANDDWTLDPDLQVTGYGLDVCDKYFCGDLEVMKKRYLLLTRKKRKPAKRPPEAAGGETHDLAEAEIAALQLRAQGMSEDEVRSWKQKRIREILGFYRTKGL